MAVIRARKLILNIMPKSQTTKSFKDIPLDTAVNCIIYQTSVDQTCNDLRLNLLMNVMLPSGGIVQMRDIAYLNPKYQKKIDAIYRSMSLDPSFFAEDRETKNFSRLCNKPFQLTFKESGKGYVNAYTYLRPNTAPSKKSLDSNFGAKRGQIHDEYMSDMHYFHQTKGHVNQMLDNDNERDERRYSQWN